jgi:hypothetical protein
MAAAAAAAAGAVFSAPDLPVFSRHRHDSRGNCTVTRVSKSWPLLAAIIILLLLLSGLLLLLLPLLLLAPHLSCSPFIQHSSLPCPTSGCKIGRALSKNLLLLLLLLLGKGWLNYLEVPSGCKGRSVQGLGGGGGRCCAGQLRLLLLELLASQCPQRAFEH